MDDEQQGAWWTTPPRPAPRRTGEPDGAPEVRHEGAIDADPPLFGISQAPPARQSPQSPPVQPHIARGEIDPPTRPVEYLTVRLEPEQQLDRGFGDTMDVPVAAMPRMRQAAPDNSAPPPSGFRRAPAILIGIGVLVVIVTVAVIASIVATGVDADRTPAAVAQSSGAAADLMGGTQPDGFAQVSSKAAAEHLRTAGQHPAGVIKQGFTWQDKNGENLLVTLSDRTTTGTTLTVVQVAGLDGRPRLLRTMVDPNLPECSGADQRAGFTAGSMFVRDLDSDGIAEATVGWWSRCGASAKAPSVAKLALLSNGDKYIIRGEGVIGGAGTSNPAPVLSRWPKAYRAAATTLYKNLYF